MLTPILYKINTVQNANYNSYTSNVRYKNNLSVNYYNKSTINPNQQLAFKGVSLKATKKALVEFWKNPFRNPDKILGRSNDFGIKEYETLSNRDKKILRKYAPYPFMDEYVDGTINIYKTLKQNLKQKFPDGCTVVSIGRSPATLSKTLQSEGYDIKFCPISQMRDESFMSTLSPKYINNYKGFLGSIGLTKEKVNESKTPYVFIDYTCKGISLNNFQKLLAHDTIGIKGENAIFLSLNNDLLNTEEPKDAEKMTKFVDGYFKHPSMKRYSPIEKCYFHDIEHNDISNGTMSDDAKIMQFRLLDKLKTGTTSKKN